MNRRNKIRRRIPLTFWDFIKKQQGKPFATFPQGERERRKIAKFDQKELLRFFASEAAK
jgi:hypothetical protein